MIKLILLSPFILLGFIASLYDYKKSGTKLTYKEWQAKAVEAWIKAGKPSGQARKIAKEIV